MRAHNAAFLPEMETVSELAGAPVEWLEPVGGGRNSRVYHIRTAQQEFALKCYPSGADGAGERLARETKALTLMERHGLGAVPRLIAADPARGFALLSWLDASPLGRITAHDIDQAVSFLATVGELERSPDVRELPLAREACLSGREIERQIEGRLARLGQASSEDRGLRTFLEERFRPCFARLLHRSKGLTDAAGLDFNETLREENRCLSPSDFGFHNCLRRQDGSLVFFDFEYFGWDDPVKLTADIMLHPATRIAPPLIAHFRRQAALIYGGDLGFCHRLRAFYTLFAMRWVLILLNEFLPEAWRRRVRAGARESWDEAKERQLERARDMLAPFEGNGDGYEI